MQELKETNEEMNSAFMRLHDFAVKNRLLDQVPELAQQFHATVQTFLTLAQQVNDDSSKDDDQLSNGGHTGQDEVAVSQVEKQLF